jgi:hypothetical protein
VKQRDVFREISESGVSNASLVGKNSIVVNNKMPVSGDSHINLDSIGPKFLGT